MSTNKISKFLKSILFALVVTLFFGLLTPIVRYLIVTFMIIGVYPILFKKFSKVF